MVQSRLDLPEEVEQQLGRNQAGAVVVKRLHFEDYKLVRPDRLEDLGENRVDRARASVSREIGIGYDIALAMVNGDL